MSLLEPYDAGRFTRALDKAWAQLQAGRPDAALLRTLLEGLHGRGQPPLARRGPGTHGHHGVRARCTRAEGVTPSTRRGDLFVKQAREVRIDATFPTFAAGLFGRAMAAGHADERLAALIEVPREQERERG